MRLQMRYLIDSNVNSWCWSFTSTANHRCFCGLLIYNLCLCLSHVIIIAMILTFCLLHPTKLCEEKSTVNFHGWIPKTETANKNGKFWNILSSPFKGNKIVVCAQRMYINIALVKLITTAFVTPGTCYHWQWRNVNTKEIWRLLRNELRHN